MKKLIIIFSIALVLVMIIWYYANYAFTGTDNLYVSDDNIKLTSDKVEIKVELVASVGYITDYIYYIEGDSIYIRIRTAGIIMLDTTKTGSMRIAIETDTSAINKIYLIGWDKTDTELIWERK